MRYNWLFSSDGSKPPSREWRRTRLVISIAGDPEIRRVSSSWIPFTVMVSRTRILRARIPSVDSGGGPCDYASAETRSEAASGRGPGRLDVPLRVFLKEE